jgi:hypothetical protein
MSTFLEKNWLFKNALKINFCPGLVLSKTGNFYAFEKII